MTTNSTTTAKELLKVMATHLTMQQKGITKPPEAIKAATKAVAQLELLHEKEKISIIIDEKSVKYFQDSIGEVLAEVTVFNQAAADGLL